MEEKAVKKKFGFWNRVKTSIFKLEDYGTFLSESPTTAFKYFFLLILLVVFIITLTTTFDFSRMLFKASKYVENELPDFEIKDGVLHFDDYLEGYDHDYDFTIIADTSDVDEVKINDYFNKIKISKEGILLLKDKMYFFSDGQQAIDESYTELESIFGIQVKNRSELKEMFNNNGKASVLVGYFLINFTVLIILDVFSVLADLCLISVVGWLIATLCGLHLKMIGAIELSIYSLTLSILLNMIYSCVHIVTGSFVVEYFTVFYLLIAYVYLIASLFIIRDDLIKLKQEDDERFEKELKEKVIEEREKEENIDNPIQEKDNKKEDKEDKKEDTKEDEKEENNNENQEPDGSEI